MLESEKRKEEQDYFKFLISRDSIIDVATDRHDCPSFIMHSDGSYVEFEREQGGDKLLPYMKIITVNNVCDPENICIGHYEWYGVNPMWGLQSGTIIDTVYAFGSDNFIDLFKKSRGY